MFTDDSKAEASKSQPFGMVRRRHEKDHMTGNGKYMLDTDETIKFFMSAPGTTMGLHGYIMYYCKYNSALPGPAELALKVGKTQPQISVALKNLWQAEILWKVKRPGRHMEYFLNPFLHWEGTESARKSHVALLAPYRILPPTRK